MPYAAENDNMIVQHVRHAFPDVLAIYRFGSTMAGDDRTGQSDVDVAVYSERPLDVHRLWSSAQALAEGLARDVDLIDLARASTVMAMQVINKGKRLFCRDRIVMEAFESRLFADYVRLNEERAAILRDVRERGRVYG